MIKDIVSNSSFIRVNSQYKQYVANNGNFAGELRFNTQNQMLEAYDGNYWVSLDHNISLENTERLSQAIEWVEQQMRADAQYLELSSKHDSVKNAYEKYLNSKKELDCIVKLLA